jgi:transcriptional regulator with XRE-family HTH domain
VSQESTRSAHPSHSFAERLNKLFDTCRAPNGAEYSLADVSKATQGKLSRSYLSLLRSGSVTRPRIDKVQLLAEFFRVPVTYFTDDDTAGAADHAEMSDALRSALAKPGVAEVALRAGELGPDELALVLELLAYSKQVAARIRAQQADTQAMTDTMGDRGGE